ncbi:Calcium-binding and coiled-coil domain-containing protein 2 [Struthio camelus australis]|uniref:Calcium-binding and coiled-coil domain-containing protein 2 n=1 Tax=Struthio camelus australis TaxID=441894 RepID=A0A093HR80_STRCA|nr:PREDICTED: calcium-binding and coiled-coil domain-containing protein 2 [Struthio camelus australis]KFV81522.1 Calcium-binding and coiled-coil domain-containing protein 2 [Struthio camelus australis]
MDETLDEPPTSAVLLDNCHFSQVIFNNVEKFYVPGGDITCYYTLTNNIAPRGKDWVGIFRVGWKTTREYYTFMWAPLPGGVSGDITVQQQIQFKAYYLPKDDEYYQFCYVDQDGVVRGASVPFQFRAETEDDILVVTTQGEVEEIELQNKNLLKENEELKESCTSLRKQNMDLQEQLKKTQELQNDFESLKSNTKKLDLELNSLRKENKHLKELDNCRETELHQLKEQIQNVTSEKERLENRLKTALDRMDQLQSQVLNYEKEVENLARLDVNKTEQLESLKEENRQLLISIAEQREHKEELECALENLKGTEASLSRFLQNEQHQNHDLMKELEEKKHLFQILQAKKDETDKENQKLREKNEALLRRVSQNAEISSFSAVSPSQPQIPPPAIGDLVFGNPYRGANLEAGATDMASIRKCPMCDEIFPEDIDTSQYEAHVQSHLLECPLCSETFETSNKQVYDDHIYCHGLE